VCEGADGVPENCPQESTGAYDEDLKHGLTSTESRDR
jgi:hypothetical protein